MGDFDEVLKYVGLFGPYQIQLFVLVNLFDFAAVWAMLLPVFSGATPDWWCEITDIISDNATAASSMANDSQVIYLHKQCSFNDTKCSNIIFHQSFTSIVTQFGLVCDLDYVSDLITTLQMVGLAIGATVSGQMADIFGRKKVLFVTHIMLVIFGVSSGLAPSWPVYAALRLFVGAAIGGLLVTALVLPIEYVGIKWRTLTVCLGFWAIGLMILPLWAYFIRNWRHLCIATSCACIPLAGLWWFIPESCRWLVSRGRFEEAHQILNAMADKNKTTAPDLQTLKRVTSNNEELNNKSKYFSYWHLCLNPKSALYTFICMYAWFSSSIVYYGISFNLKNLSGDRYINFFLSGLVEIPALIFVLLVSNKIGRRWTLFSLFLISGLSLGSIMIIDSTNMASPAAVLILALIGKSAASGGWAAVQVSSAETFPTLVRNIGLAACAFMARIGGVIAPQIVSLNKYLDQLPFVIFGSAALLCAFLSLVLTETAELPLPDQLSRHKTSVEQDVQSIGNGEVALPLVSPATEMKSLT